MICEHEIWEMDVACHADGMCPLCLAKTSEHLRRVIAWCRPRLSKDVYRTALDNQLANPQEPDDAKMVKS